MTVIVMPTDLRPRRFSWGQRRNDMIFQSPFGSQGQEIMSPWWTASMSLDPFPEAISGRWKSLLLELEGQKNQLSLWDMSRPVPKGTMRGSPTVYAGMTRGSKSLSLHTGVASCTLEPGDLLGIGLGLSQQVVMVTQSAVANGSGDITFSFQPALRNDFSSGTTMTWDRPRALFRSQTPDFGWSYETAVVSGFSLNFIEDPRS